MVFGDNLLAISKEQIVLKAGKTVSSQAAYAIGTVLIYVFFPIRKIIA